MVTTVLLERYATRRPSVNATFAGLPPVVSASLIAVAMAAGGPRSHMGVTAAARVQGSSAVIHGCYQKQSGALRVLDASVSSCGSTEAALDWNRRGPAGPAGVSGLPYIGPVNRSVLPTCIAPDCVDEVWADCPPGTRVIGGGYLASEIPPSVAVRGSWPVDGTSYTGTHFSSWVVNVKNSDVESHFITIYAICAHAS